MNPRNYVVITALLLAAPLSAQQTSTTIVPDVNVNLPPLQITNEITLMTDSAMIANLAENNRLLREMLLAERECDTCGGASTTAQFALGVVGPLLLWIAISAHRSAGREPDVFNAGDVTINGNQQDHDHEDSEGN